MKALHRNLKGMTAEKVPFKLQRLGEKLFFQCKCCTKQTVMKMHDMASLNI